MGEGGKRILDSQQMRENVVPASVRLIILDIDPDLHDNDFSESVHQFAAVDGHERRPIHRSLPSHQFPFVSDTCYRQGKECHQLIVV